MRELSELTVLLVDDSRAMRRIIRRFLEHAGACTILEAGHGEAALEILTARPVDLVVCDLNMPVMNGMELLKTVRSRGWENLSFVMLTVEAVQKTMNQALEKGADSYIVKPVTREVFLAEIMAVLERKS